MEKKAKFKVGDIVGERIIVEAFVGRNFYGLGQECQMYGYKYKHEPAGIKPVYCSESTLIRRCGSKANGHIDL